MQQLMVLCMQFLVVYMSSSPSELVSGNGMEIVLMVLTCGQPHSFFRRVGATVVSVTVVLRCLMAGKGVSLV